MEPELQIRLSKVRKEVELISIETENERVFNLLNSALSDLNLAQMQLEITEEVKA